MQYFSVGNARLMQCGFCGNRIAEMIQLWVFMHCPIQERRAVCWRRNNGAKARPGDDRAPPVGGVDDSSTLNRRKAITPRSMRIMARRGGGNEILQENSNHSIERRGCCTVLLAFPSTLVIRCPGVAMSETLGFWSSCLCWGLAKTFFENWHINLGFLEGGGTLRQKGRVTLLTPRHDIQQNRSLDCGI